MILSPGTYGILNADGSWRENRTFTTPATVRDGRAKPVVMTAQPAINAATQKVVQNGWTVNANDVTPIWQIVALSQVELDAVADAAEGEAVKALRDQLGTDIDDSILDQTQAQTFIDLAAPTNAERNTEMLNAAKRDKAAAQRFRRLARAVRSLLKDA